MSRLIYVILFVAAAFFTGCDNSVVFEQNQSIANASWNATNSIPFEFDVVDTVTLHNLYINMRNGEEYPFSNIYLFVEILFPNGKRSQDTLECFLADPIGNWVGTGLGDIYFSRFLYQKSKTFPLAGHYSAFVSQAMRTDKLAGIYDVGFRIEKSH